MGDVGFSDPGSISPLPLGVARALPVVAALGMVSFITTSLLFARLTWMLLRWKRQSQGARVNQFVILIFNLILADMHQAIGFTLNVRWLQKNAIKVGTPACFAQGWFISTGDLSSGVFTFAIALHAFGDIVWNRRLGQKSFMAAIASLWAFVFLCSIVGIGMHPTDFFLRAGPWCFINNAYNFERLWLHYFWIILVEFGTVVIYSLLFLILNRRIRESFYTESKTAIRARSAAKMIVAYPIVYIICTLPVVTARLGGMAGGYVNYTYLCVGGAMITSNGWLDVLLYTLTRSAFIFHGEMPEENVPIIETFHAPGQSYDSRYTNDTSLSFFKNRHLEPLGSRNASRDGPWGFDPHAEDIRIKERASLSVRMMAAEHGAQGQEAPRFFQRIYAPNPPTTPAAPNAPVERHEVE